MAVTLPFVIHVLSRGVAGCAKAWIMLCCSVRKSAAKVKKTRGDFIITSWHLVGKPLENAIDELPFSWGEFLIHLYLPAILGHAENWIYCLLGWYASPNAPRPISAALCKKSFQKTPLAPF
jgi:hypothetical protein